MFGRAARTRHEPEPLRTNRLVIEHLRGDLPAGEVRDRLSERDKRMRLELESSHPLAYVADELVALFPESRFVVTVREPRSWLRSRLSFHQRVAPAAWQEYRDYFWTSRQGDYAPEEASLEELGLCSLDVYLAQYADHYRRVLAAVPEDRLLVVRTQDIDARAEELADFLRLSPSRVVTAHDKRSSESATPLDTLDPAFVSARILAHCEEILATWFPDSRAPYLS